MLVMMSVLVKGDRPPRIGGAIMGGGIEAPPGGGRLGIGNGGGPPGRGGGGADMIDYKSI